MTPKLLVVDDQPDSLKWLYEVLQTRGFHVLLANSGELALQAVLKVKPDLVLLDVQMPRLNGYEVCRRLKASPECRDLPVLFLSAVETPAERIEGFRAGAIDFIEKPFEEEEVVLRVQTHWELRRLQLDLEAQVRDRTRELESALDDKKLLMRELQHRVKNHLTLVSGLLSLTESSAREGETAASLLDKARSRVQALSSVYDLLYRSDDLLGVDFASYARRLLEPWTNPETASAIQVVTKLAPVVLAPDQLIPLGLIVTELVTNSFKYAFGAAASGRIEVGLEARGDGLVLWVEDDGVGFPARTCPEEGHGLGWQLVASLSRQLKGSWSCASQRGTRIEVTFPTR